MDIHLVVASNSNFSTVNQYFDFTSIIDVIPFETAALPTIKTYPINYNPVFYIIGILFALFTTVIAGLFPALKASRVDPVEIIRGK